ncbi:hypothetical protein ACQKH5_11875 [Hyphomonas sp. NPDC076900]|uniref:hypothetical protein n=1 Tax=unclassified Hyphomonas TaxID=2630699 RepID=UPI003D03B661
MFRYILSALAGAMFVVCNAFAEPSMAEMQSAARWSAQLQTAVQDLIRNFDHLDEYSVIMEQVMAEMLTEEEALLQIGAVTASFNKNVDDYVAALEAMPPHPMASYPLGKAMIETRENLVSQAGTFEIFFGRLDTLSRKAIEGDGGAVVQLSGEVFRSAAFLLSTEIAMMRPQIAALETMNPLRNLNLAVVGQNEFMREVLLAEASFRFGPSPGFSNGDLSLAAASLAAARREVANGRRNTAKLRSLLLEEKAMQGADQAFYDKLIGMVETFSDDWTEMNQSLTEAEALLKMMNEGDEDVEAAFDAYLESSGIVAQNILDRQLARSSLVAN